MSKSAISSSEHALLVKAQTCEYRQSGKTGHIGRFYDKISEYGIFPKRDCSPCVGYNADTFLALQVMSNRVIITATAEPTLTKASPSEKVNATFDALSRCPSAVCQRHTQRMAPPKQFPRRCCHSLARCYRSHDPGHRRDRKGT